MILISSTPLPNISGTNIAITPHAIAATNARPIGGKLDLAAIEENFSKANMNIIAIRPKSRPLANKTGTIGKRSDATALSVNSGSSPKTAVENHTDVILAIAIGVSALKEKCLRTASCANTIPAIGA